MHEFHHATDNWMRTLHVITDSEYVEIKLIKRKIRKEQEKKLTTF